MLFVSTPPPTYQPPQVEVTYINGPTTIIEIDGYRIMTDPTLDAAETEYPGPVVLKKTTNPSFVSKGKGAVEGIDLVLLSHDHHPDNLDNAGRKFLGEVPSTFTTKAGATRLNHKDVVGLGPWEFRKVKTPNGKTLRITATPARHGPVGIEPMIGEVTGFVVTLEESKRDLIYITGDTVWFEGIKEVSKRFKPASVMLFAGAAQTSLVPVRLTMDTNESIEVANAFPDSKIIPVHCEGWNHFKQSKDEIKKAFSLFHFGARFVDLNPGVKTKI